MMKSVLLHVEEHDRRIFWISAVFFIAALSLYIYFLGVSVIAVIERKGAEQRGAALTASIMNLESKYVTLNKQIDLSLARERGFVDVVAPVYISGEKAKDNLSLRTR
jgi:hypothetical protein